MRKDIKDNLLQLVKSNYQKIAGDFDMTRKKEIWPEIRKRAEEIKDGDRILDVGCGNGRLIEAFENKEVEYLGVDNSEELIRLAEENYDHKFLVSDILDLSSFEDKDFDYAFCLAVLQHLPSVELRVQALEQIKMKLKDEGKMVVSNWNLWAGKHRKTIRRFWWKKVLGRNKMDYGDITFPWKNSQGEEVSQRYYHAFRMKELKYLAKKVDMKIEDLYKDKHNYWLILKK